MLNMVLHVFSIDPTLGYFWLLSWIKENSNFAFKANRWLVLNMLPFWCAQNKVDYMVLNVNNFWFNFRMIPVKNLFWTCLGSILNDTCHEFILNMFRFNFKWYLSWTYFVHIHQQVNSLHTLSIFFLCTQCSATCSSGPGNKTRTLACHRSTPSGEVEVDITYCPLPVPHTVEECHNDQCPQYWIVTPSSPVRHI